MIEAFLLAVNLAYTCLLIHVLIRIFKDMACLEFPHWDLLGHHHLVVLKVRSPRISHGCLLDPKENLLCQAHHFGLKRALNHFSKDPTCLSSITITCLPHHNNSQSVPASSHHNPQPRARHRSIIANNFQLPEFNSPYLINNRSQGDQDWETKDRLLA